MTASTTADRAAPTIYDRDLDRNPANYQPLTPLSYLDRAARVFQRCFDAGLLIRTTGDIVALSPPLIIETPHVDRIVETLSDAIRAEAA